MYSDGLFESTAIAVHQESTLPEDAMILYKMDDLDVFLNSAKDLAICNISYPQNYDQRMKAWKKKGVEEIVREDNLEVMLRSVSEETKHLIEPFRFLLQALDRKLMVGLSLTVKTISDQMCPLFHVDNLQLRFIVTLQGPGTQWLCDKDANRKNIGKAGKKPIAKPNSHLQQISTGQVALLKGLKFKGSKGLVHRSPAVDPCAKSPRLFMRLDFDT